MRHLDRTDVAILERLQYDARVTNVELAQAVNLSPTPCYNRVKAMEAAGLMRQQVTLLAPELLGLNLNVFIHVTLVRQSEQALAQMDEFVARRPEVMECYLMSGEADYLLRIVLADVAALERFLLGHLTKLPHVANIRSSFALKQVRYKTALPLPRDGLSLKKS